MLNREYEQLLTQFSRELERLQLKHQDEVNTYFEIFIIDMIANYSLFHVFLKITCFFRGSHFLVYVKGSYSYLVLKTKSLF